MLICNSWTNYKVYILYSFLIYTLVSICVKIEYTCDLKSSTTTAWSRSQNKTKNLYIHMNCKTLRLWYAECESS